MKNLLICDDDPVMLSELTELIKADEIIKSKVSVQEVEYGTPREPDKNDQYKESLILNQMCDPSCFLLCDIVLCEKAETVLADTYRSITMIKQMINNKNVYGKEITSRIALYTTDYQITREQLSNRLQIPCKVFHVARMHFMKTLNGWDNRTNYNKQHAQDARGNFLKDLQRFFD